MNRFGFWGLIAILAVLLPSHVRAADGTIGGTVTRSDNAQPIASGTAFVLAAADFSTVASLQLNQNGQYLLNVAPGNYVVLVVAPTFATEFYDNVPCVSSELCDVEAATVIALASGQLKVANFALDPLGSISGTVRRSDTNALVPGVTVSAYDTGPDPIASATTDATGAYELFVYDGSFKVRTRNTPNLLDELYDNVPCNITGCNELNATLVAVQNAGHVTGKNFVLTPGSVVSGHVTRADGEPLDQNPSVEFTDALGNIVASAAVGFDGAWAMPFAVSSGSWRAVLRPNSPRFFPQVYANRFCGGANQDDCIAASGDPIVVSAPSPVSNVDFVMYRSTAAVSGTIKRYSDDTPLGFATITAFKTDDFTPVATEFSSGSGEYTLEMPPGEYFLLVQPPVQPKAPPLAAKHESAGDLLNEVYPGLQCFDIPPNCEGAATLSLASGQDVENVDFALAPSAHLTVSLKNQDTNALMDGNLKVLNPGSIKPVFQFLLNAVPTEIPILNGGSLRLAGRAFACGPAGDQVCRAERNDGSPCIGLACDLTVGTPIAVTKGEDAGTLEFVLEAGRRVSGFVRDAGTQVGIPDVKVEFSIGDIQVAEATTQGDGSYLVGGLFIGPYFARTRAPFGYLDELYPNLPCPPGACTFSTGTSFVPPADQILTGIDFTLAPGGSIHGTVKDSLTQLFLDSTEVSVYDAGGALVASATSLFDGKYASQALPPGNYYVSAARTGYASQLYQGENCPDNVCVPPSSGTVIAIVGSNDTANVDFALVPDPQNAPPRSRIFLNRCVGGCTVTAGFESSINNTSSIISGVRNLSNSLTAPQFESYVACMKDMYAPFNVDIVTSDPSPAGHQEVMIGASATQLGFLPSVGGVSPWNCGVIRNAIVFAFTVTADPEDLCWTTAQELGHSFGLDHEFLCPDPMTYLTGCGAKHYQDVDAQCGEYTARECVCGSETQNSYRRLLVTLGPSPAIFADGFEQPAAAAKGEAFEKVFGPPLECAATFDPYLREPREDRR